MLEATEFDLKTGQTLTQYDPQTQRQLPKARAIQHSYLEHWLNCHGLAERPLWVAQFYPGVTPADQQQLAQEGKVLLFTNAHTGYFSDAETARYLSRGDPQRGIEPLYGYGQDAAHFLSAYGSLPVSDGGSSAVLDQEQQGIPVRIWVVDEEQQDWGTPPRFEDTEAQFPFAQMDALIERLGDGVMLVSPAVSHALLNANELRDEIRHQLEETAPSELWVEQLAEQYATNPEQFSALLADPMSEDRIQQALRSRAEKTVSQFRAATPELPGMLKGALSSSELVDELGVDVLCSVSCVKGDDGRLSRPGIHEVSQLWLNRKLEGRYRTQAVGAQVKGVVLEATANELNPKVLAAAEAFAEVAGDVEQLAARYLKEQETRHGLNEPKSEDVATKNATAEITAGEPEEDWLSQLISQDPYGVMLNGFPTVVDKLERFVRHERLDQALRGIRIPSAMAQPHHQLRPWEICNRSLPEGALVAYYRSPLPSISAVAVAINHTEAIEQSDPTAFRQRGVAYLNPWTASQIAITDFDGDFNGYFVGYVPTESGLPQRLRAQLQQAENLSPAEQYEAARQQFAELIAEALQPSTGASTTLQTADYPRVVAEVIEQTAPERRPPSVVKLPKLKHPWHQNETLAQATWRAWSVTAENPIGRVANAGMVLQSFAAECRYARSDETKAGLLDRISTHFQKQLRLVAEGKLDLPDDDTLTAKGFPAYDLKPRFQSLANANGELQTIRDPAQQQERISHHLQAAHDLLLDIAQGPNAANLQTAVDGAKSARGIDESLYRLALALQYKPHQLRQHRNDARVYTAGRPLPTNTDEPIGWMVEAVNELYQDQTLNRANNVGMRFGSLMDGVEFNHDQRSRAEQVVTAYLSLMQQRSQAQRQQQRNPGASRQPSLTLTSTQTGRSLQVERLIDATAGREAAVQDLWRTNGPTNWQVTIEPVQQRGRTAFAVRRALPQSLSLTQPPQLIGWVSEASAQQQNLGQFFRRQHQLEIASPVIQVHPPLALQNDADALLEKASRFLAETQASIPAAERVAYAAAMWSLKLPTGERVQGRAGQGFQKRARLGMAVALQLFPEAVGQQLQQLPPLTLSGTRYRDMMPQPGVHDVVTRPYRYLDKAGYVQQVVGIALVATQDEGQKAVKHLGFLGDRALPLPSGLILKAEIQIGQTNPQHLNHESITIQVQELLEREASPVVDRAIAKQQYAPTYDELQRWWRAVRGQPDCTKLDQIAHLGQQLVRLHQSTAMTQNPPSQDYRHVELLLNAQQKQQMDQDLKATVRQPLVAVEREH